MKKERKRDKHKQKETGYTVVDALEHTKNGGSYAGGRQGEGRWFSKSHNQATDRKRTQKSLPRWCKHLLRRSSRPWLGFRGVQRGGEQVPQLRDLKWRRVLFRDRRLDQRSTFFKYIARNKRMKLHHTRIKLRNTI